MQRSHINPQETRNKASWFCSLLVWYAWHRTSLRCHSPPWDSSPRPLAPHTGILLSKNEFTKLVCFKVRCLSEQGSAVWELWGKGCCWYHSLKEIPPPQMHLLGALLFPQLLSSCHSKFLAGFILASPSPCSPPKVTSKPSYFLKISVVTSLLSPGLMCLAQSRCVQQSWSPGPASGGCWLPSPAQSSRQPCSWIPADSLSQTADAKIGKKYN